MLQLFQGMRPKYIVTMLVPPLGADRNRTCSRVERGLPTDAETLRMAALPEADGLSLAAPVHLAGAIPVARTSQN